MMEKTRLLKRIAFINIANTDYSSAEIAGNTCFVGTNNLGKTTLQRAILFFYNANTRGLGIAGSQRSFEDYYFQYPNSYIIYEVMTEESAYHVLVYRNNKICYRFIDQPYDPALYIRDQEAMVLKEVLAGFNEKQIFYSDQIDTFERYRNILYGADPDKRYKTFALLKGNSLYHNIPLAIQAIFLSSESVIKSEFVKDCIANSISSKHTTIELKTIERQLRQFSERYHDIETFFRKENARRATIIKDNFAQIRDLKQRQRELAAELGSALGYAEIRKGELEASLKEREKRLEEVKGEFALVETAYRTRVEELIGEKAIYRGKVREAEKKWLEYERGNISELLRLTESRPRVQSALKAREAEYLTLTSSFQDTEQRFKTLSDALHNEQKDFENGIAGKGLQLDRKFQEDKSEIMERLTREKESARQKYQESVESLKEDLSSIKFTLKDLEFQIREGKRKVYFEAEIQLIQGQLREIAERKSDIRSAITICQNTLETLKKEADHVREKGDLAFEQFKKENREEIAAAEDEIKSVEDKLSVYQGAFLGFLQANYPGWLDTIGKVCDEELLYSKVLNPRLGGKLADSLYGIQIDLEEMEVRCRSLEQLELEKGEWREYISAKKVEFLEYQENHEKEIQRQLAALGREAGKLREELTQRQYRQEQDEQKEKQLHLDLLDWKRKGDERKEADITALYEKEQQVRKEKEGIQARLNDLASLFEESQKQLTIRYDEQLYQLKKSFEREAEELTIMKEDKISEFQRRREWMEREKSSLLKNAGVDDALIKALKQEVESLREQLDTIERHSQWVSEYVKDKRELFDPMDQFVREQRRVEELQEEERRRFEVRTADFERRRSALLEEQKELEAERRQYKEGIEHFNRHFRERPLYGRLRHVIEQAPPERISGNLIDLCSQLLSNDMEYHKQFAYFKNHITEFAGRFRPDNHFNFKVNLQASEAEYEQFAGQLQSFYNENRIQISIAEVAKSHGMLIDAIATKVKALTDHKGRINRMVAKMENDFSVASFKSSRLIEYIKLKSEDSENKVLRRLRKIADFREQHPFSYGEENLFTTDYQNKMDIDRKSVDLLNDLLKTITEENYDEIRVQDLFELRFRIKEGKNDTGWIEKIDKVGSTGTDMLVKAVIYITLLNVFIKESTERTAQSFKVHCIIDEVGQISAPYLKELIAFAEERNIYLINGLPNESKLETHYNYTYKFRKNAAGNVKIIPLLSINVEV